MDEQRSGRHALNGFLEAREFYTHFARQMPVGGIATGK